MLPKLIEIKALPGYKLFMKFNDGVGGVVDVSDLAGKGVFEKWKDISYFEDVKIGESGAPTWRDELDIDPLHQYLKIIGKTFEEYIAEKRKDAA